MTGERGKPKAPSFRRLERKVDDLATAVEKDREATTQLALRVDALNLNGSAAALHRLAENTSQLLELASVAPTIVDAVSRQVELATWWKVTKGFLNPFKRVGAFIWVIVGSAAAILVANWLSSHRWH